MRSVFGPRETNNINDVAYKYECSLDVAAYILYVQGVLESIHQDEQVKASYDTGYGITLTDEHLGDSPMTLFVVQHKVRKVEPPRIKGSDEWDLAWSIGKKLINDFIAARG